MQNKPIGQLDCPTYHSSPIPKVNTMLSASAPDRLQRPLSLLLLLVVSCQLHAFSGAAYAAGRRARVFSKAPYGALRHGKEETQNSHADSRAKSSELWTSLQGGNIEDMPLSDRFSAYASTLGSFVQKNFFLLGMLVAVSMAKAIPSVSENEGINALTNHALERVSPSLFELSS
jgi:hypothetical protein